MRGVDNAHASRSGRGMKHEVILAGDTYPPRDLRVDVNYDVSVECEAGEIDAELTNLSSDGFRLHSDGALQVGWEVTLQAARDFPVKAMICWACGNESGGVFSEAVAL